LYRTLRLALHYLTVKLFKDNVISECIRKI